MPMTAGFIRDALSGTAKVISENFDRAKFIQFVSTDSRTVTAGDLFVALKGDVYDGHDFIAMAAERGCKAFVCEKFPAGVSVEGVDIYLVENSLNAFRLIGTQWRELLDMKVIAVAGSVGKTTTKDLLSAMLAGKWKHVLKTKGSQNGFVGIPMTLTEANDYTEVAVVEVGIDAPGAMIQHIDVVRPDVAIVTAISEEHLEWLKDLETIAYEENLILKETAQADGVAVINLDDPWIAPLYDEIKSNTKIGFTLSENFSSDVLAGKIIANGSQIEIKGLGASLFRLELPLPGEHNARNLLGAAAVAIAMGLKPQEIIDGLKKFKPSGGRSQWDIAACGAKVLCDFYNANPASMRAAFAIAKQHVTAGGKIWLCLADMKELGLTEEQLHRDLAKEIIALNDKLPNTQVLLYGERMKWLNSELETQNFLGELQWYEDINALSTAIKKGLNTEDLVVVKGSRSMKMERVWESLK